MHSSRMRTVRRNGRPWGCLPAREGVSARGCLPARGVCLPGGVSARGVSARQNDRHV